MAKVRQFSFAYFYDKQTTVQQTNVTTSDEDKSQQKHVTPILNTSVYCFNV